MKISGCTNWNSNSFIISQVNIAFLKKHKINMQVKDFKAMLRKLEPDWIGLAGGSGQLRKVNVYNINSVKKYLKLGETNEVSRNNK